MLISGALLLCAYVYSLGGFQREAGATIADIRITVRQRAPVEPRRALGSDAELLREAAATVLALQQAGEAAKQEAAAAAAEKQAAKQAGKQAAAAGKAAEAAAAAAQPAAAAEAKPAAAEAKPAAFPGSTPAADAATDDVAAAVLAGAGVHGFVDKAGPLDPRLWRGAHKGVRDKRLLAWMLQRRKALDAGARRRHRGGYTTACACCCCFPPAQCTPPLTSTHVPTPDLRPPRRQASPRRRCR